MTRGRNGRFVSTFPPSKDSAPTVSVSKDSWKLTKEAPGGPEKIDLIPSYGGHIASYLWDEKYSLEHRTKSNFRFLSCIAAVDELRKDLRKLSLNAQKIVRRSGLSQLSYSMSRNLDYGLLEAFIERWQPDTNSFHLPFGEMTITLHDVRYILQVPIKGKCLRDGDQAGLRAEMASLLGLSEIDLDTVCLPGTKANWIKSNAICVPAMLKRSWIYEYFECFRPLIGHPEPRDDGSPLAGRWDGATDVGPDGFRRRLEHCLRTLDEMHAGFVTWFPFHKNPGFDAPDSLFRGVIRFVDVAEHYDPSRVLRQFGYVQVIPEPRIEPEVQKRPVRGVSYTVTFSASTDSFWGCKTARISLDTISVPVDETRDVAPEYMSWYLPRTHLRIVPPTVGVQIQPELPLDQAAFQIIDGINPLLRGEGELSDAEIVRNYRSVVPSVWRMFREFRQRRPARPFHG
ncbi:Protein MAINTENANCE OF MERISTEMS [Linum grandiflorum]